MLRGLGCPGILAVFYENPKLLFPIPRRWNRRRSRDASCCVAHFNVQTLAERSKCRLDLVQPGVMPERKQTIDVCLGYADPARELRFDQARLQECGVQIDLCGLQGR